MSRRFTVCKRPFAPSKPGIASWLAALLTPFAAAAGFSPFSARAETDIETPACLVAVEWSPARPARPDEDKTTAPMRSFAVPAGEGGVLACVAPEGAAPGKAPVPVSAPGATFTVLDDGAGSGFWLVQLTSEGGDDADSNAAPDASIAPPEFAGLDREMGKPGHPAVVFLPSRDDDDAATAVKGRFAGHEHPGWNPGAEEDRARLRFRFAKPGVPACGPVFDDEGRFVALLLPPRPDGADDGLRRGIAAGLVAKAARDHRILGREAGVRLGVQFASDTRLPRILSVRPGSAAERAGLRAGDIVIGLAEQDIESLPNLMEVTETLTAGVAVEVETLRGTRRVTAKITPELAPEP